MAYITEKSQFSVNIVGNEISQFLFLRLDIPIGKLTALYSLEKPSKPEIVAKKDRPLPRAHLKQVQGNRKRIY